MPDKPINYYGYPEKFFREVVLQFQGDDCLIWPYARNSHGYGFVSLKGIGGHLGVHRQVCIEINGPPPAPSYDAAHSCGNGHIGCVNPRHLSWKTRKENHADKLIHGTDGRGEKHHNAKLTEIAVREIRARAGYRNLGVLAREYGVTRQTVWDVVTRKNWYWLE